MKTYLCEEYNGYMLVETTSGGRAGKGYNRTASIKVMSLNKDRMFGRYHSFFRGFDKNKKRAIDMAKTYIDLHLNRKTNEANSN